MVVSSLCLEFAAADIRQFNAAVRNVASLVKCNGHLVLQVLWSLSASTAFAEVLARAVEGKMLPFLTFFVVIKYVK